MNISGENSSVVCIDEEDESANSSSSDEDVFRGVNGPDLYAEFFSRRDTKRDGSKLTIVGWCKLCVNSKAPDGKLIQGQRSYSNFITPNPKRNHLKIAPQNATQKLNLANTWLAPKVAMIFSNFGLIRRTSTRVFSSCPGKYCVLLPVLPELRDYRLIQ